jgi:D-arabinose 1-dehydrogenase-like Zn-dependent alcohol dehydrogenase
MLSYQVESFGKPLAQVLRDTPAPQGSEVLLEVRCCGVCHSDVHLRDGYFALGEGDRLDLSRGVQPPRTLGHEIAGSVVGVGADVQGLAVGARRVVFPWIGCGRCALCDAGDEHLCAAPRALGINRDGGFASHVLVPHPKYLLEYEPLAEEQACTCACSGLTAYSALRKLPKLGAGDTLLLIGAGGVGLSGIRLARHLVAGARIVVAERDPAKWDLVRATGADDVVDPGADGALKALVKGSGGGVAAAVDFVGAASTFAFGFGALRKSATLVCVGLFGGAAPLLPVMLPLKALRIVGSYVGSLHEMHELMSLARSATLPPLPVSTRPLADAEQALADLKDGRIRGRAVLRP